jgi:DNA (cytosine-5)-methyltransferase 1
MQNTSDQLNMFETSSEQSTQIEIMGGGRLIITFGSPCQDFSLAGKGAGLGGDKSSLIKYAIFLIRWLKPDVFIWENVKGAYSTNDGADYWAIIQAFTNLDGYRCETQLLNTAWFLPQNRERIYLIGHLAGSSEPGVFPVGESDGRINERVSKTSIVRAITAGGHSGGHHSGMTLIKEVNPNISYAISATYAKCKYGNGRGTLISANTKKGFEEAHEGDSINFSVPNSKTRRGRVGVAQTLDTQCNQGVVNGGIRRLTEIECERLQGFPDDWTKFGNYDGIIKEIPKTQRYKMLGNAITTKVVTTLGKRIKLID